MRFTQGQIIRAEGREERFEVVDLIGEGRTADVYKVRDAMAEDTRSKLNVLLNAHREEDTPPEYFALKIAKPGDGLGERNGCLHREQYVLERAKGPGLPKLKTNGWYEGRAFIVLDFLAGPNLNAWLHGQGGKISFAQGKVSSGRFNYQELVDPFLQLVESVAECHRRWNFIHRDIRPSNVILDRARGATLFDFDSCELHTRADSLPTPPAGAAEYVPPEVIAHLLDPEVAYVNHPRRDVYSLGVLLFSFLTGQLPVKRKSEALGGYLRELRDIPPEHVLKVNPDAPPALAALTMRLLAKEAERPGDAQAVVKLLKAAIKADADLLDKEAPTYEAGAETLLTTFAPQKKVHPLRKVLGRIEQHVRLEVVLALFLTACVAVATHHDDAKEKDRLYGVLERVAARTATAPPIQEQAMGALPSGTATSFRKEILFGLKMPDKPMPNWLRPGKDGICRNSKTGEELRPQVVIRGSCWDVGRKLPGEPSCPRQTYDPPPEVLKDPSLKDLHGDCFIPWYTDVPVNTIEPRP